MKSMIIGSIHACNMKTNYMEKIVEGSDDAFLGGQLLWNQL